MGNLVVERAGGLLIVVEVKGKRDPSLIVALAAAIVITVSVVVVQKNLGG